MKPKRHFVLLEAVEPVAHGDTLTGVDNATNTRLFMRSAMLVRGVPMQVPDISENALRTVAFRVPLALHLLKSLGIEKGSLPQSVTNLLFSGGNVASGSRAPSDEIELGHRIRELYPSLELLGGAVDAFILPRSRLRIAAWPVAREFEWVLERIVPELAEQARQVSVFDLLSEEVRTRGTGSESEGNQMLYQYEVLAAGARFLVEITLEAATSPAAEAAVAVALDHWDGYFGGQARQGRGRLAIVEADLPSPGAYVEHLKAYGEAMKNGLLDGTLGTGKVVCAS